jgi:hypothetical protein
VLENRMMMRMSGPQKDEVTQGWRNCIMNRLIVSTPHKKLLG